MMKFKKPESKNDIIVIVLKCILFLQFLALCYFNLIYIEHHIGYDTSVHYMEMIETWRQKRLFLKDWVYQTTPHLDSPVVLGALIYGITKRAFFSYGLAMMIYDSLILYVLNRVLKQFEVNDTARWTTLNLPFILYISSEYGVVNPIGYADSVTVGNAAYVIKCLIALLVISIMLDIKKDRKDSLTYVNIALVSIFTLFSAMSAGLFVLMMIVAPILAYYFICALIDKDIFKFFKYKETYILYALVVICIAGKFIAEFVFKFEAKDSSMALVRYDDYWSNAGAIFIGWLAVFMAAPGSKGVQVLTPEGIMYLLRLVIAIFLLVSAFVCVYKKKRGDHWLPLSVLLGNIFIFLVSDTRYGGWIFEIRYLSIAFFMMVLLGGLVLSQIYDGWKGLLSLPLFVALMLLVINVHSDYYFHKADNQYDEMKEIIDIIDDYDVDLVYVFGESLTTVGRNIRCIDTKRTYKVITDNMGNFLWGDTTKYSENAEYEGPTCLIMDKNQQVTPPGYIAKYYTEAGETTNCRILYSSCNRLDYSIDMQGDKDIDFSYTPGYTMANGAINEKGEFVTNKAAGYALYGDYIETVPGKYDFTLYYTIVEQGNEDCRFDINYDKGAELISEISLDPEKNKVTLEDVEIEGGRLLEQRVYNGEGAVVAIDRIERVRVN